MLSAFNKFMGGSLGENEELGTLQPYSVNLDRGFNWSVCAGFRCSNF